MVVGGGLSVVSFWISSEVLEKMARNYILATQQVEWINSNHFGSLQECIEANTMPSRRESDGKGRSLSGGNCGGLSFSGALMRSFGQFIRAASGNPAL
jgi:hypothetical protein